MSGFVADPLGRFVMKMRRRGKFGCCCVCLARRPAATLAFEPSASTTVELRICDHRCAYKLGMLTSEAIRAGRN